MNPADQFEKIALSAPNLTAIVSDDASWSYASLNQLVWSCVSFLQNEKISAGMTIGIETQSQLSNLVISLAAFRMGASQFTLNNLMSKKVHTDFSTLTKADAIVSDFPLVKSSQTRSINVSIAKIRRLPPPTDFTRTNSDIDTYFYLLGSGTTSTARIIRYTSDELSQSIKRDLVARSIVPHERHYSLSPVEFFTAKRRSLAILSVGGTVVFCDEALGILELCHRFAVDHLSAVVVHFEKPLSAINTDHYNPKLPRMKSIWIGGSPVSEIMRKRLRNHLSDNIYVTYGCNEVGEVTVASSSNQDLHPGTIGHVLPGIDFEIVNSAGDKLPAGQTGLIRFRGQGMFDGYVGEPRPKQMETDDQTWFFPGDLALMTDDGTVIFKGRSDDLMIYNGMNIYPREIETVLEAHPAVAEVAALPFTVSSNGDIPVAFVSLREKTTESKLLEYCKEALNIKAPQKILILEKLPRNIAGKINKQALAEFIKKRLKAT